MSHHQECLLFPRWSSVLLCIEVSKQQIMGSGSRVFKISSSSSAALVYSPRPVCYRKHFHVSPLREPNYPDANCVHTNKRIELREPNEASDCSRDWLLSLPSSRSRTPPQPNPTNQPTNQEVKRMELVVCL